MDDSSKRCDFSSPISKEVILIASNFLNDVLASFATSLGSNAGKAVVDDGEKLKQQLVNEVKQRHID